MSKQPKSPCGHARHGVPTDVSFEMQTIGGMQGLLARGVPRGLLTSVRRVIEIVAGMAARRIHRGRPEAQRQPPRAKRPRCGARCRSKAGAPCAAPVVAVRGADGVPVLRARCRLHGGLSTGARTAEGRARLREAGRRGALERWRRWRAARGQA